MHSPPPTKKKEEQSLEYHAGPHLGGIGVPQTLAVVHGSVQSYLVKQFDPSFQLVETSLMTRREGFTFLAVTLLYYNIYTLEIIRWVGSSEKLTPRLGYLQKTFIGRNVCEGQRELSRKRQGEPSDHDAAWTHGKEMGNGEIGYEESQITAHFKERWDQAN